VAGRSSKIRLGNLEAKRDWGHARDYVEAMWLMLQQETPDDYVIASGVDRSVRDLIEVAFGLVGLEWRKYVEIDQAYMRPAEVPDLRGDPSKARAKLGWVPRISFEEMIREMLQHDLEALGVKADQYLQAGQAPVA
jgi:GDPmannose 4,6-dehydratase